MKNEDGLGRVGGTAAVYCAAILEYLTAEVRLDPHCSIGKYGKSTYKFNTVRVSFRQAKLAEQKCQVRT